MRSKIHQISNAIEAAPEDRETYQIQVTFGTFKDTTRKLGKLRSCNGNKNKNQYIPGINTKRVFSGVSIVSTNCQVISFSVLSLCLFSSSFCIQNGGNSAKSNHMLSTTSYIELEFFLPNLRKCPNCNID